MNAATFGPGMHTCMHPLGLSGIIKLVLKVSKRAYCPEQKLAVIFDLHHDTNGLDTSSRSGKAD